MTNEKRGHVYSFGAFRVDAHDRLLFKADREIPLTPKVFDTLLALIENSSHGPPTCAWERVPERRLR